MHKRQPKNSQITQVSTNLSNRQLTSWNSAVSATTANNHQIISVTTREDNPTSHTHWQQPSRSSTAMPFEVVMITSWPEGVSLRHHVHTQVGGGLPVDHACLTLHRVVQRQWVEVQKLLQLFKLHHTVGFVSRPQHQRSVRPMPCSRGRLTGESPLAGALSLDPTLTSGSLLLWVGNLRACCLVQVHLLDTASLYPLFQSLPSSVSLSHKHVRSG